MSNPPSAKGSPGHIKVVPASTATERDLYDIALDGDVLIEREDGAPIADFAGRLIEATRDRNQELKDCIEGIRRLDLNGSDDLDG